MKEVILVRHGKSSWDFPEIADKDRPLNDKGINDAKLVSMHLRNLISEPDAVFSSPANRALHTCMIFMNGLNYPASKAEVREELYTFSPDRVLEFIHNVDQSYQSVMIFGHNPGFSAISNTFGNQSFGNLPTCGVVKINFEVSQWKQIKFGNTEIVVFPKQLYK